ncbi:Histone deacetylase [Actinomortierella ambigua]|nr:Histone deacetylase [Actinomortierella ambigua]
MDLKLLLTPTQKEEGRFELQDSGSSGSGWQEERPNKHQHQQQQQQQQQQEQQQQQQQQQHSAPPHHHLPGNAPSHHGYHNPNHSHPHPHQHNQHQHNHQHQYQHQHQHPHQHPHPHQHQHQHAHQQPQPQPQQQQQYQLSNAYSSHENVHHQPVPTHNHPVPIPPAADPAYHHHHQHFHAIERSTSPAQVPIMSRPPVMEPPLLSISSPSPMAASSQSTQYFVPTHHSRPSQEPPRQQQQQQHPPPPPPLPQPSPPPPQQQQQQQQQQPPPPPPSGLNLSSYGFLLMEKRDREREAMERANMNIINDLRAAKSASSSPAQSPAQVHATPPASSNNRSHVDTAVYQSSTSSSSSSSYQRRPEPPAQAHSGYSDSHHSAQYFSHPSHAYYGQQHGYDFRYHGQPPVPHYAQQQVQQQQHGYSPHGHHSSFTANVGYGSGYEGYQAAAEDSDGGASVSSSGSHKRRRRLKQPNGKKGSGLTQGHFLAPGSSPTGSAMDYYDDDDDSDDDNQDVRKGLQRLNLQKSIKTSASDQVKKLSKSTKPPFKIGELVESMKSDTDGTWFAGRVLDLEDDPHDHINPKSVLIHYEGFSPHHDEWVKPSQLRACSTGSSFLRYGPLGAESPDNWVAYEKFYNSELGRIARRHTGLVYDRRMLLHKCQCGTNPEEKHHPEQPERLVEILGQFQRLGMLSLVKWVQGREATMEELETAHTLAHVRNYCCTRSQNRQYALDHGLEWESSSEEEENEENTEEAPVSVEEGPAEEPAPKKRTGPGRPRKKRVGNNKQAEDSASVDISRPSKDSTATITEEGVKESGISKIDTSTGISVEQHGKDDIDMLSPRLARRRSSMRGGIRISSMVSMSSTLYPQNEEGAPSPQETETPVVEDDDDDDDDKANQAGPPPSEAALAVAGGMDLSLASKLPTTSPVPSTMATFVKQEDKPLGPMECSDHDMEDVKDLVAPLESVGTTGAVSAMSPSINPTPSPLDASISKDNIIDKSRRTSRSMQGQSGLSAALETVSTAAVGGSTSSKKDDDAQAENTSVANETETVMDKASSKEIKKPPGDKTSADRKDPKTLNVIMTATSPSATNTATTINNGGNNKGGNNNKKKPITKAVSPGPQPSSDAVAIKPPGLVYTMTCGQLGIAVDTTWNPYYSPMAARVAAGSLIALVDQVVTGRCKNGFAIIRPPGHHAEEDEAMGFCFYNNVGVAVNLTLQRYPLTIQKILIIDWDVHHGNGTQQIFYDNPNVLYISLHRWDNGHFYPFTGAPDECGEEGGEGKNVNIAWSSYGRGQAMGDVEYIAAFWYVLLPIARQFGPDLVMVSAGFDAADGHANNIGGYTVSPQGFAIMTRLVQTLAGGRVILSLEGGYEFEPLATSAAACLEELLPHSLLPSTAPTRAFPYASFHGTLNSVKPNTMAVSSLHQVLKYQQKYWKFPPEVLNPSFRFHLPAEWKASNSLATRPRRERNTRRKAVMDT